MYLDLAMSLAQTPATTPGKKEAVTTNCIDAVESKHSLVLL